MTGRRDSRDHYARWFATLFDDSPARPWRAWPRATHVLAANRRTCSRRS